MAVTFMRYPSGPRGTKFTIDRMREMVKRGKISPTIISAASTIIRNAANKDYFSEAEQIFNFVKQNIRYTRDPEGVELVQAPWITLKRGQGDCDDQATIVAALAAAIGMQTGFEAIRGSAQTPDEFTHVYAVIRTNKGWRAADTTVDEAQFGWRPTSGVFGRKLWIV